MDDFFERTNILLGSASLQKLLSARVLLVGVGGVGSYVAEALVRAGVGHLTLIDGDEVKASNKNRQLVAVDSTLGKPKVTVMKERARDIYSGCQIETHASFLTPESVPEVLESNYDFVLDAVDDIRVKEALIEHCYHHRQPFISSMGAGRRLDPSAVCMGDLSQTTHCPLAKKLRYQLRKKGIDNGVPVVYSTEIICANTWDRDDASGEFANGTISYMPAIFGLMMAGYTVRQLLEKQASP
jgi:tRNA A37 threonylcarbamoyladenosine dehydratase